ncbi:Ig-like domain-containing protein [Pantoea sp. JK]|uniref:Ig-like domain-containing protein n=1 Tax=Pantoea sp. JK TaxID=2871703 RepID=UPI002238A5AE|nr:Ig-like domain-containing protein [Pantoea sp. JK]
MSDGDVTDDAQPKISGTAEAGSTVIVYDRGVEIGRVQADNAGNWSFTPVPPLLNGDHEISAKAQDAAGNIGDASNSIGFELLTGGVPSAPAIVNVIDDVGHITGNVRPGGVTDDTTPTIVGTAKPGHIVTVIIDGQAQGSVISDANGHWEYTPATALTDGPHAIIATAKDSMGNSMPDSGAYNIIVDTIAPVVGSQSLTDNVGDITGPIASGDTTDDSSPTYSGVAEPGSIVIIKDGDSEIGRVTANSKGEWSFTPSTPLADGPHSLSHQVQDQAGNLSAVSTPIDFIVDTSAVVVSISNVFDDEGKLTGSLDSGSVTDDTTPTLNGIATANALVTIKNGNEVIGSVYADARGNWKFTPEVELKEGLYKFTATAEGKNGSVAVSDAFDLTIDTTPPNNNGIGDIKDNVGGIVSPIQDGGLTDDTTPELGGSGQVPGDVVTIIDNGQPIGTTVVGDDGSWSYTPETPISEGSHDFTIIVTDPAGNDSQESDPWNVIVDTKPPVSPSIDTVWDDVEPKKGEVASNGFTNDQRPELRGSAEANAIVIIYQNGVVQGSVVANASGKWAWTPSVDLNDATFKFSASQLSPAGVEGEQSTDYTVTVDTSVPNAPVITSVSDNVPGGIVGPIANGGLTNDSKPTVSGTAEPHALIRILDGNTVVGSVYATDKGAWSLELPAALSDGTHTLTVKAEDRAGNVSPQSNSWSLNVDTLAPSAPVITNLVDNVQGGTVGDIARGGLTNDNKPTLSGTAEPNALVKIMDGGKVIGSVFANATGNWSLELVTALPEGSRTLTVTAEDKAGNVSPQSSSWVVVVDTVAPSAPVINSVADNVAGGIVGNITNGGLTNDNRPTLTGTAEANALILLRDGTSTIYSFYADSSGKWSFELPASLADGNHSFSVMAQDAAGNLSAQSASWNVTVDTVAPGAPQITNLVDNVTGGVVGDIANGGTTNDNKPTLSGITEPNALITIRVDNVVWGSVRADGTGKWQLELTKEIPDGSHEIRAFAEDAAGNVSAQSNPWTVIIDTKPFTGTGYEDFSTDDGVVTGSGATKTITFSSGLVMQGKVLNTNVLYPGGNGVVMDSVVGVHDIQRLMQVDCAVADLDIPDSKYISFLYSYNNYAGAPEKFSFSVYDTNGNILETKTFPTGAVMGTYSYQAPDGVLIGKVEINSPYTLSYVDNVAWGDGPKVRSMSEDQSDDPQSMIDDGHIAAINSDDENQHDGHQTEATVEQHGTTLKIVASEPVISFDNIVHEEMNVQTVDMTNSQVNVLNISIGDVLVHGEEGAFTADDTKQLMIKGDKGDVVNLSDLLPDGTDPGNWAKAEGTVTVSGVQYEVYQHSGAETELLVQLGVQTNLNNH